jgi:hypothetical protein
VEVPESPRESKLTATPTSLAPAVFIRKESRPEQTSFLAVVREDDEVALDRRAGVQRAKGFKNGGSARGIVCT